MIFFYISLSTYICFNVIKYKKVLLALQQNKYNIKDYGKWIFKNSKQTFLNKELLAIILIIITLNFNLKVGFSSLSETIENSSSVKEFCSSSFDSSGTIPEEVSTKHRGGNMTHHQFCPFASPISTFNAS